MKINISNLNTIKVNIDAVEYPVNRIILQEQGQQPIDVYVKNDFATQCFTIESLVSNNSITFTKSNYAQITTMYVSEDNGETWAERSNNAGWVWSLPNIGDKLLIKGTATLYDSCKFSSTGNIKVYGNIMSLLYDDNFVGQTSLPQEQYVFYGLFNGCTTLVDASNLVLPATTLASRCYSTMFYGCISLVTAPTLPAATLAQNCYQEMFYGCTSLNYIKCLATDISASGCTRDWVKNVAASGTFVKASNMSSWPTYVNGIPNGWTVENATA